MKGWRSLEVEERYLAIGSTVWRDAFSAWYRQLLKGCVYCDGFKGAW
jgi:hypothetical protein